MSESETTKQARPPLSIERMAMALGMKELVIMEQQQTIERMADEIRKLMKELSANAGEK